MIYDDEYFASDVEGPASHSAASIAASIVQSFRPTHAVDIGCGTGALAQALQDKGCRVVGLDSAPAAITRTLNRGVWAFRFDIEVDDYASSLQFDLAISMEVAEHLPAEAADRLVALLASLAPVVVFTAAPPGQGGAGHINEQPKSYWIERFAAHGYDPDEATANVWVRNWRRAGVAWWYSDNLMIFRKR